MSNFDDSTVLTTFPNDFDALSTRFAFPSAFFRAASNPSTEDASHETMPGIRMVAFFLNTVTDRGSFTSFTSVFNALAVSSEASSVRYESTAFFWAATAEPHAPRATETLWSSQARYPHTPPTARTTATAAATPTTTGLRFFLPAGTVPSTGVDCGMVSGVMLSFSSMTTPSRLRM
ncbi:hypothetical protein [Bifidobacterium adolescentis]|uniref:hypothetical protein n=1 Tax=Bifidobacterium adolescentis TaxID=1680 RepID=UPI001F249F8B|nr:hypothetical protein [Bifidobacterium adolescentis]